jgi:hypothetical protein
MKSTTGILNALNLWNPSFLLLLTIFSIYNYLKYKTLLLFFILKYSKKKWKFLWEAKPNFKKDFTYVRKKILLSSMKREIHHLCPRNTRFSMNTN